MIPEEKIGHFRLRETHPNLRPRLVSGRARCGGRQGVRGGPLWWGAVADQRAARHGLADRSFEGGNLWLAQVGEERAPRRLYPGPRHRAALCRGPCGPRPGSLGGGVDGPIVFRAADAPSFSPVPASPPLTGAPTRSGSSSLLLRLTYRVLPTASSTVHPAGCHHCRRILVTSSRASFRRLR